MPQRTASKRASGKRSAPALLARWAVTPGNAAAASRKRSIWARANASSASSAVARWLMMPTTCRRGTESASASVIPQRPIPLSIFRWTPRPSGTWGVASATSSRASRATTSSPLPSGPMTRIRAEGRASRRSAPSSAVATQRPEAPASSAARAAPTAPWPYPSAFTTAHSSAGAAVSRRYAALRRSEPRSIEILDRLAERVTAKERARGLRRCRGRSSPPARGGRPRSGRRRRTSRRRRPPQGPPPCPWRGRIRPRR